MNDFIRQDTAVCEFSAGRPSTMQQAGRQARSYFTRKRPISVNLFWNVVQIWQISPFSCKIAICLSVCCFVKGLYYMPTIRNWFCPILIKIIHILTSCVFSSIVWWNLRAISTVVWTLSRVAMDCWDLSTISTVLWFYFGSVRFVPKNTEC